MIAAIERHNHLLGVIMSTISDLTTNVANLGTEVTAVQSAVSTIQAKLAAGSILSPADQAALDNANSTLTAVAATLGTLATTVAAL
jgi:hypothetical protein